MILTRISVDTESKKWDSQENNTHETCSLMKSHKAVFDVRSLYLLYLSEIQKSIFPV